MAYRPLFLAVLFVAIASPSAAQSSAAQPTYRSGVDLVRFDVRVVDEAGRPVTDLRRDEIEILEDGRPLPLVLFQRVVEPSDSYVDAAMRAVSAEVSSNEAFPRGHLYILIFDQLHITPGNEQRARLAAEQFLRRRVRPSDRVAIFGIPGPGPQLGFTSDTMRALAALDGIRGSREARIMTPLGTMSPSEAHRIVQGDEKLIVEMVERMVAEGTADLGAAGISNPNSRALAEAAEEPAAARRLLRENARTVISRTDAVSREFLQRLADVVADFRDIEGRKTVVLFSEGFYQDNISRELEAVAAAAAQSYAVFYTFDLNSRTPSIGEAFISDTNAPTEIQARLGPLGTLAVETDGMLVVDAASRAGEALDRIADQAQEYYLLGFTPSDQARLNRGSYRRLSVRVTRPGTRVSARTGYALPGDTPPPDRRRSINRVLGAPFVQQGLAVTYTTYVLKGADQSGHRVVLTLDTELPVRSQPGDTADIVFVVRDARDGRVAASGTDVIALPARPERGSALGRANWRVQFNVPAGSYFMRALVREPSGLAGSADRRLDVRALDGPEATVSDLVVGSSIGGLPVRPRAYAGNGLTGVIESYGRTTEQLNGLDVRVELRRLDDGVAVARMPATLQEPETDAYGVSRRATFHLPLSTVPPGQYLAHAVVSARGEVVAERTRQVEVIEGTAPAAEGPDPGVLEAVPPIEIVRGELAQGYIRQLRGKAEGTPLARAAARAAENQWEAVELELRGAGEAARTGMVAHALRGLALFVREQYPEAAAELKAAFDADPRNAETAFFLGWASEGAGDSTAALSAWRSAAYLNPSLLPAHLALADGYLRLSQPALAVQALRAGLVVLPASSVLQARLDQIERSRR
ncbi:MAG TPA: VWA domain-containing protein [Vicinamibacterales bacterium]|nr:VWA domain-containing protein [Vicinamibacterales bacterium]